MSRHALCLTRQSDRAKAHAWIDAAPQNAFVEIHEPRRSDAQNRIMWVWLGELSRKLPWHGVKLSPEDYKDLLTASLRSHLRTIPNTEGTGFVVLGMRTSKMSKAELSELLELIQAFAAQHGVELSEPEARAA